MLSKDHPYIKATKPMTKEEIRHWCLIEECIKYEDKTKTPQMAQGKK